MKNIESECCVSGFLLDEIPGFLSSEELSVWSGEDLRNEPLLVGGSLAAFLVRLEKSCLGRRATPEQLQSLDRIYATFEDLATNNDVEIQNYLQVFIFEAISCEKKVLKRIISRLRPRSRSIFDEFR